MPARNVTSLARNARSVLAAQIEHCIGRHELRIRGIDSHVAHVTAAECKRQAAHIRWVVFDAASQRPTRRAVDPIPRDLEARTEI